MAKISLRAYIKKIDTFIDQGQVDEGIAHCKYILKLYPKHIETYKLLGKAYLENQRYSEGSDILQRVLSVIPDDFVSQIGMSIIREDEGNLDAAIWHMERAFEIQPSNSVIQEELKRLFGRRDGVQPPKIRLTRGALVRMYIKGELYPQAIAEARAALNEDPNRIDMEVLIARMYHSTNQDVESVDVCSKLITKLPYCFEANQILSEILPSTSKKEDAQIFKNRIIDLDPYAQFISTSYLIAADVPDNLITVEELEWQASPLDNTQQPDWAKNIGANIQPDEEQVPDWLTQVTNKSPHKEEEPPSFISSPQENMEPETAQQEIFTSSTDAIPDWMRETGWSETEKISEESFSLNTNKSGNDDLEALPADIPDWLHPDPSEGEEKNPGINIPDDNSSLWLSELEDKKEPVINNETPIVTDLNNAVLTSPENMSSDESFAWLESLAQRQGVSEDTLLTQPQGHLTENVEESDKPEGVFSSQEETPTGSEDQDVNEWLKTLNNSDESKEFLPERKENPVEEVSKPDWLQDLVPLREESQKPLEEENQENISLPPWMTVETKQGETLDSSPQFPDANLPEWLVNQADNQEPISQQPEKTPEAEEFLIFPEQTIDENIILPPFDLTSEPKKTEATQFPTFEDIPDTILNDTEPNQLVKEEEIETGFLIEPQTIPETSFNNQFLMSDEKTEPQNISSKMDLGNVQDEINDVLKVKNSSQETMPIATKPVLINLETDEYGSLLDQAQQAIKNKNINLAIEKYSDLIGKGKDLEKIISDLNSATFTYPVDISLWQTLGDAYAKNGNLIEALNSYTKAEELLG